MQAESRSIQYGLLGGGGEERQTDRQMNRDKETERVGTESESTVAFSLKIISLIEQIEIVCLIRVCMWGARGQVNK